MLAWRTFIATKAYVEISTQIFMQGVKLLCYSLKNQWRNYCNGFND